MFGYDTLVSIEIELGRNRESVKPQLSLTDVYGNAEQMTEM